MLSDAGQLAVGLNGYLAAVCEETHNSAVDGPRRCDAVDGAGLAKQLGSALGEVYGHDVAGPLQLMLVVED